MYVVGTRFAFIQVGHNRVHRAERFHRGIESIKVLRRSVLLPFVILEWHGLKERTRCWLEFEGRHKDDVP